MFEDLKRTGALLRPADSAAKLVALLRKRNFKSGDHVDFYDEKVKEACSGAGGAATVSSVVAPAATNTVTVASAPVTLSQPST